jgi:2-polyprenyl-3-methyl-5-hydroxy-6-metoxy-1,4-benzoquinol methylase
VQEQEIQYPADFVDRLEILWGEGFLSPGGPQEVRAIVAGIDLTGKSVLDVGCGTGGVDIVLAGELKASRVVAIDVQAELLDRAQARLESAQPHLAGRVEFHLVSLGPLNWPNETFDVVFSKDSLIHITDKAGMYDEVLRVLKHSFHMATAAESETMLRAAGFVDVTSVDRNAWYSEYTKQEVRDLEGPLRERLLGVVDEDVYQHWLEVRRALRDAVNAGAMRPTHLRGFKAP